MQHRLQSVFIASFSCCFLSVCITGQKLSKETEQNAEEMVVGVGLPKEVIVIGAGMAGLAAARRISSDRSNFTVKLYEARKDRYGGRVWTDKLTNMKARGAEVDLGGSAFNVIAKNNPLLELAEDFDLKVVSIKNPQLIIPWQKKTYSGDDLKDITHQAAKILGQALNDSAFAKVEMSMKNAIDQVLLKGEIVESDSASALMVQCLPSYIIENYSTRHYRPEVLDVGYDKILVDGMGELIDRLLSGSPEEPPLHLNLNKVARQVKVDKKRDKVIVRFRDGSQTQADIVVVAVPSTAISSGDLLFEPDLPKAYQLAAHELSMSTSNKVIVEFEQAFWSSEFDVFLRAVKDDSERGSLQTWLNLNNIVNKPALTSVLLGEAAVAFEKMDDEKVQDMIIRVLSEMFGEETVKQGGKIVRLQRSQWVSDPLSRGTSTYPKVGSDPKWWDTFADPLCPYIYFAGEYTTFDAHGTLHGAYNSGIRAGGLILTGHCEKLRQEEERRRQAERRKKKKAKKTDTKDSDPDKTVDDEEEDDFEGDVNDQENETIKKRKEIKNKEDKKTEL